MSKSTDGVDDKRKRNERNELTYKGTPYLYIHIRDFDGLETIHHHEIPWPSMKLGLVLFNWHRMRNSFGSATVVPRS